MVRPASAAETAGDFGTCPDSPGHRDRRHRPRRPVHPPVQWNSLCLSQALEPDGTAGAMGRDLPRYPRIRSGMHPAALPVWQFRQPDHRRAGPVLLRAVGGTGVYLGAGVAAGVRGLPAAQRTDGQSQGHGKAAGHGLAAWRRAPVWFRLAGDLPVQCAGQEGRGTGHNQLPSRRDGLPCPSGADAGRGHLGQLRPDGPGRSARLGARQYRSLRRRFQQCDSSARAPARSPSRS